MRIAEWNYGDAYLRYPIGKDEIFSFNNKSKVKVHNIFDPLPGFMKKADLLFVDPPWNLGNLNTFYLKAGREDRQKSFELFYKRLFECISEISPPACFVEVGKEYLPEFVIEVKKLYRYVTFYNSSYYHRKENICYVINGRNKRKKLPIEYMDEEDIIKYICAHEEYECIADLCMGRGLVGYHAYLNNKRFVGTELNNKRLSVLIEKISKLEGK